MSGPLNALKRLYACFDDEGKLHEDYQDQLSTALEAAEHSIESAIAEQRAGMRERLARYLCKCRGGHDQCGTNSKSGFTCSCYNRADAILAAIGYVPAPQEYQPIETAPKDNTVLLLWWPYWRMLRPVTGWFHDGRWDSEAALSDSGEPPTHWMHLPEPPKEPR